MEKIMGKLYEFVILNPKETLPKGTISKKIAMDKLQPFTRDILGYDVEPYAELNFATVILLWLELLHVLRMVKLLK